MRNYYYSYIKFLIVCLHANTYQTFFIWINNYKHSSLFSFYRVLMFRPEVGLKAAGCLLRSFVRPLLVMVVIQK